MDTEIWKFIPNFENYMVSNRGRIKNLTRDTMLKPFMKISKDNDSYRRLRITVSQNGKSKNLAVHKLVAEAFVENASGYTNIAFRDNDPSNVDSRNIVWISDREHYLNWKAKMNQIEYVYYGNDPKPIKATNIKNANEIEFPSISEAVKFFKTRYRFISRVLRGVQQYHKDYKFEFVINQ